MSGTGENRNTDSAIAAGVGSNPNRDPLTNPELRCLAKRLIVKHVAYPEWLDWEDVPELGEHEFERLTEQVNAEVQAMWDALGRHEVASNIDSAYLLGLAR